MSRPGESHDRGATAASSPNALKAKRPIREKFELATAVVGLATAVAAGVFGLVSTRGKVAAEATAAQSETKASDSADRVRVLQDQIAARDKRIADLEAQLATSPGAEDPTPTTPAPDGVFHEGSFTLLIRHQADLDAQADDPQWGTVSTPPGAVKDIEWRPYEDPTIGKPEEGSSQFLLIGSAAPTEGDCKNLTGYAQDPIALTAVKVGTYFCWITDQGRYAVVRIKTMPKDLSSVTIAAIVFKKDGD
jgi:hypothetical protein